MNRTKQKNASTQNNYRILTSQEKGVYTSQIISDFFLLSSKKVQDKKQHFLITRNIILKVIKDDKNQSVLMKWDSSIKESNLSSLTFCLSLVT